MQEKDLKSYGELQMYWRQQIKSVLPADKNIIFWRNNADGVKTSSDDILHYWGAQDETAKCTFHNILVVNESESRVIMSQSDYLYLNKGNGFIWGNTFGDYSIWKSLYHELKVFPDNVDPRRILGSVVCLWGEVSNQDTLENNLWMRAAAFSYRVWT